MRVFFQTLPSQPLAVRRRFVVLATAGSFALIVVVWGVLLSIGGRPAAGPPSALPPDAEGAGGGSVETPVPTISVPTLKPSPTPTSPVDVGEISAGLLRALSGGAR